MACTLSEGTIYLCSSSESSMILSPTSAYSNDDSVSSSSEPKKRGRKRCLDHLSLEEKILRKKLKNREAAQVSRDRKKARMDQLEYTVDLLIKKNKELENDVKKTKLRNKELQKEIEKLKTEKCVCSCKRQEAASEKRLEMRETLSQLVCDTTQRPAVSVTPLQKEVVVSQASRLLCLLCLYLTWILSTQKKSGTGSSKVHLQLTSPSLKTLQTILSHCRQNQSSLLKSKKLKWWGRHQNSWNPVAMMDVPQPV